MQGNQGQVGAFRPHQPIGLNRRLAAGNIPGGQNVAHQQAGRSNIPPAVNMWQNNQQEQRNPAHFRIPRGPQGQQANWNIRPRVNFGIPQHPIQPGHANIQHGQNQLGRPVLQQNRVPRQGPNINRGLPWIQPPVLQGYGQGRDHNIYQPQVLRGNPYPPTSRSSAQFDPNMTLEEALNGGFSLEEVEQTGVVGQNRDQTARGADSRLI